MAVTDLTFNDCVFILLITLAVFIIMLFIAIRWEKKNFNNGICSKCSGELEFRFIDSQGGRSYKCKNCSHAVWASYNFIDKWNRR